MSVARFIGLGEKGSFDDEEAGPLADEPFNPRQLMARRDDSPRWVGANALVLGHAEFERGQTLLRAALTDKDRSL
jgi:hypothetical protein